MLKCCLLDSVLSTLLASRVLCYCVCLCSFSLFEVIFGPAVQCPHLVSPWWRDGCSTKVKHSHRRSSLHLALMSSLLNLQIFFIFKRKKKHNNNNILLPISLSFFFFCLFVFKSADPGNSTGQRGMITTAADRRGPKSEGEGASKKEGSYILQPLTAFQSHSLFQRMLFDRHCQQN